MCFKRRTSLPAGFTHRGNSTRYVLCSSNQSHSNITTPQEIQSLPTKQMKICLPRRKSFMIGDCCKWTAHLCSYANQKYTPWTPQHKKYSKEPSLWGCEAPSGSDMTQNASTHRLLLQIHAATQDFFPKTPCDTFTVIYYPAILSYPSALKVSNEICCNVFYNWVSQDLNLPLSTIHSVPPQQKVHTENTHCKSWLQTIVWI